jgi:hypothetical protein
VEVDVSHFAGLPVQHSRYLDGGIPGVDEDGNETETHAMMIDGMLVVSKELWEKLQCCK